MKILRSKIFFLCSIFSSEDVDIKLFIVVQERKYNCGCRKNEERNWRNEFLVFFSLNHHVYLYKRVSLYNR